MRLLMSDHRQISVFQEIEGVNRPSESHPCQIGKVLPRIIFDLRTRLHPQRLRYYRILPMSNFLGTERWKGNVEWRTMGTPVNFTAQFLFCPRPCIDQEISLSFHRTDSMTLDESGCSLPRGNLRKIEAPRLRHTAATLSIQAHGFFECLHTILIHHRVANRTRSRRN